MVQRYSWILQAYHYGRPSDIGFWVFTTRRAATEYMRYHHDGPIFSCERHGDDWYYYHDIKSVKILYRIMRRKLINERFNGVFVEPSNQPDLGPLPDRSLDRKTTKEEPEEEPEEEEIPDGSPVAIPRSY